ncbi:MAG: choline-sulfatase [Candidatus Hydrogenedentota bacterium]
MRAKHHFPAFILVLLAWMAACSNPVPPNVPDTAPVEPKDAPAAAPAAPPPPPNVVFILIDTWRADSLQAERAGMPVMPKLRAFAEASRWYTFAITQCSWTKPSMVSMFSSQYPMVHNVMFGVTHQFVADQNMEIDVVPPDLETMPAWFKANGYATAGIQSNANLSPETKFDRGFDSYYFEAYPEFRGNEITDKAIETWQSMSGPRFLYVHYMDPHRPYDPPQRYRELMQVPAPPVDELPLLENFGSYYDQKVMFHLGAIANRTVPELSDAAREYVRALYDAECRFADDEVDRLIQHIRANDPNAIIVLTADHGEELWDHGSLGHGMTVYQEGIHIPLVFSVPGEKPQRIDAGVELIDILPTLANKLQLPAPETWQGLNLFGYTPDPSAPRPLYSMTKTSLRHLNKHWDTVIVNKEKLIVNRVDDTNQLFHLDTDAGERSNLSGNLAEDVARLRTLLDDRNASNQAHPQYRSESTTEAVDSELVEKLKTQGYVR